MKIIVAIALCVTGCKLLYDYFYNVFGQGRKKLIRTHSMILNTMVTDCSEKYVTTVIRIELNI